MAAFMINIDEMVGKGLGEITSKYGKYARIDESEYGFQWCVFNKDYKKFMMLGIKDNIVIAVYSNSKYLVSQNYVKIGMARSDVNARFGNPLTSININNNIFVLPNMDKRDVYLLNGYYVYYFYDIFDNYKVTAVLQVKQEYEEAMLMQPLQMTNGMIAAYSSQSIDLVNSIRARRGLKILKFDSKTANFALYRSTDMRDRNYFSHYTPEGKSPATMAKERGIKFRKLCENIAQGHRNAISAFEAFMNSKGHRDNILANVKQIGAGTAFGGNLTVIVTYILLTLK